MNWLRSSGRVLWKLSSGFFMAMHMLYQQEQEGYITSLSPFLGFSVSPFSSLLNFDCYPLFGGLPRWLRGKRICLQSRRPGCDPWIGKIPGEGNGYLLQYFCLENPMDRRAWRATVHGVAESQTRLRDSHTTGYSFGCSVNDLAGFLPRVRSNFHAFPVCFPHPCAVLPV